MLLVLEIVSYSQTLLEPSAGSWFCNFFGELPQ